MLQKFSWRISTAQVLLEKSYRSRSTGELFAEQSYLKTLFSLNIFQEECLIEAQPQLLTKQAWGSIFLDNSMVSETKATIAFAATKVLEEILAAMLLWHQTTRMALWESVVAPLPEPSKLAPVSLQSKQAVWSNGCKGHLPGAMCLLKRHSQSCFFFQWVRRLNVTLLWTRAENSCLVWRLRIYSQAR